MSDVIVRRSKFNLRGSKTWLLAENISWGLFNWGESDILVCSKSRYLTDIETKLTIADLKADFKKKKWDAMNHRFVKDIKYHYYAVPKCIEEKAVKLIEENRPNSGIIVVTKDLRENSDIIKESAFITKEPKASKKAVKVSDKVLISLARLCMFRYWRD